MNQKWRAKSAAISLFFFLFPCCRSNLWKKSKPDDVFQKLHGSLLGCFCAHRSQKSIKKQLAEPHCCLHKCNIHQTELRRSFIVLFYTSEWHMQELQEPVGKRRRKWWAATAKGKCLRLVANSYHQKNTCNILSLYANWDSTRTGRSPDPTPRLLCVGVSARGLLAVGEQLPSFRLHADICLTPPSTSCSFFKIQFIIRTKLSGWKHELWF